jgi:hypothetical protein
LLAGAAVVVAVLIAAGVVHLLQGSGSPGSAATIGATSSHSTGASHSPSAEPSPTATTPTAFAGIWSGIVHQPPTGTYHVNVSLKAHSGQGTVSYSGTGLGCSAVLILQHATPTKMTLVQSVTAGSCSNGNVTISVTGPAAVWFSFSSAGPVAAGKLTRG